MGSWAVGGNTWAPEVIAAGGRYLLYYTARSIATGRQCVGRAVASAPGGPFRDPDRTPFVCEAAEGGSIDASPFRDTDGRLYLYWKNDGNCCGKPVRLYGRALSPDGMRLVGPRRTLLTNTRPWQGTLVEAPEMVRRAAEPVLRSTAEAAGPGHGYVVTTPDGGTWLLYHAWPPEAIGSTLPGRQLWLDRIDWEGGRPVVRGPTAEPQPLPGR